MFTFHLIQADAIDEQREGQIAGQAVGAMHPGRQVQRRRNVAVGEMRFKLDHIVQRLQQGWTYLRV